MGYLVFARKYRPQTFAQLVGQGHIVKMLTQAMALGRVPHAFLFTGARGVGKTTAARLLARALNCAQGPTATPCGTCKCCEAIAKGSCSDVLEIDGASHTGVDHVRELRESLAYAPLMGRYRLFIIDEAHMLSQAAFNALLKTLEEPPAHVKFVLATTELHRIPVTILSRCQRFDFRLLPERTLMEHLEAVSAAEQLAVPKDLLWAIAREAQGSVRDALSLLEQATYYLQEPQGSEAALTALGIVDRQAIAALMEAVLAKDADALLGQVEQLAVAGFDMVVLAQRLAEYIRLLVVITHLPAASQSRLPISDTELATLRKQAAAASAPTLQRYFQVLAQLCTQLTQGPLARTMFEMALLRLLDIAPTPAIEGLIASLEAFMAGGGTPSGDDLTPVSPSKAAPLPTPAPKVAPAKKAMPAPDSPASATAPAAAPISTPPPAPPPAAQAPVAAASGNQPLARWRAVVDAVAKVRPALAPVLEQGHLCQFDAQQVVVIFKPRTFFWQAASDPENIAVVKAQLQAVLGQPVPYVVKAQAEPKESLGALYALTQQAEEAQIGAVREAALSHTAVLDAMTILGAEVTAIRPAASGKAT